MTDEAIFGNDEVLCDPIGLRETERCECGLNGQGDAIGPEPAVLFQSRPMLMQLAYLESNHAKSFNAGE